MGAFAQWPEQGRGLGRRKPGALQVLGAHCQVIKQALSLLLWPRAA